MIFHIFICKFPLSPEVFGNATIVGHLDLWSSKTPAGNSYDYRDVIVFEKLRFGDGLVWTVGLKIEIKQRSGNDKIVKYKFVPQ